MRIATQLLTAIQLCSKLDISLECLEISEPWDVQCQVYAYWTRGCETVVGRKHYIPLQLCLVGRGYSTQLVVWDVCGRKHFFCCIAITLLIRITEAMRAPEQVKKKGWFGLYAMKHNIFNDYFYWLQYEARAFCLGVWQPPVPIT